MPRRSLLAALSVLPLTALPDNAPQLAEFEQRLRLAEHVVVGTVVAVQPLWHVNRWGDRLIVSRARVRPSETLKGTPATGDLAVEVEGGTLDGITLEASHAPRLAAGERAVFLLKRGAEGRFVPAGGAEAVLKLTSEDTVAGSALGLADLRAAAGAAR